MPRAVHAPTKAGRSARSRTPYSVSSIPAPMTVELNIRPEKSWCVPSSEKCRCHHSGSLVVSTATATPSASPLIATVNERCDSGREALGESGRDRPGMSGSGAGGIAVVIIDVVIVLLRVDGPLRTRPPGTESRSERR